MGEKGSLKNRIKEWNLRRKIRLKKKQEEVLEKKKKAKEKAEKNNLERLPLKERIKVSLKFVFGIFLGFVEHISNNLLKKTEIVKKDEKNNNENKNIKDAIDIKDNEKEKDKNMEYESLDKSSKDIKPIKETYKEDVYPYTKGVKQKPHKIIPFILSIPFAVAENSSKIKPIKILYSNHFNESKKSKERELETKKAREKYVQNRIKMFTANINDVKNSLSKVSELDDFDKKRELIELRSRVVNLKKQYLSFRDECNAIGFKKIKVIDDIDPYNLRYSASYITALISECENELSGIKRKKADKIDSVKNDMNTIKNLINTNINEQDMDIDKIRVAFKNASMGKKRSSIVTGVHNFLTKTINIGMSLVPVAVCKNKAIGMLGSVVVLNNRIRSMRKMINKKNQNINDILYSDISSSIQTEKNCVLKTREMLNDAKMQLESLKQEFIMEFYYDMDRYLEANDIMLEFSDIMYQLSSREDALDEYENKLFNEDEKLKQKVKIMN